MGRRHNVWEINPEQSTDRNINEFNWHPAVFPSKMAHDHIISWSKEGDIVLDPFSGSGTTAIQAKITKRNYIGLEINQEYVEKSKEIIKNYSILDNTFKDEKGILTDFIQFK
jgi:site-specific DNA-methyltransferase (adenine-specific)